jgi:thymidylate kinase
MNSANASDPRLPVLISFSGIDGAGKSTQIDKFWRQLSEAGLSVKHLTFWDDVVPLARLRAGFSHEFLDRHEKIGAADKPVYRKDKNVCAWYLSLARSGLYLMDALCLSRKVAAARKSGADVIIFDRYIYDQLAILPLEHRLTRAFMRLILALVPVPHVAYLLDAEPEAACKRKPEYPVDFLRQYRLSYLQLQPIARLALIPARTVEEVYDAIVQRFEGVCGLRITRPACNRLVPSS